MSDWKKHLVKVSKTISIRNNDINYHTFTYKNEKKNPRQEECYYDITKVIKHYSDWQFWKQILQDFCKTLEIYQVLNKVNSVLRLNSQPVDFPNQLLNLLLHHGRRRRRRCGRRCRCGSLCLPLHCWCTADALLLHFWPPLPPPTPGAGATAAHCCPVDPPLTPPMLITARGPVLSDWRPLIFTSRPAKGQLISKTLSLVSSTFQKNEWKNLTLLLWYTPNLKIFWLNWRHQKDISKLNDL